MGDWFDESESLRPGPVVCTTHRRFIPCREDDGNCKYSNTRDDVWDVNQYQQGVS